MRERVIQELRDRRPLIRTRWTVLLKLERTPTPLGHPDALVHLFDQTFDDVMSALARTRGTVAEPPPRAACGCNPLAVYFPALEQALLEALVHVQAGEPQLSAAERDAGVGQLRAALYRIARREMTVYDELCSDTRRRDGTLVAPGRPGAKSRSA